MIVAWAVMVPLLQFRDAEQNKLHTTMVDALTAVLVLQVTGKGGYQVDDDSIYIIIF